MPLLSPSKVSSIPARAAILLVLAAGPSYGEGDAWSYLAQAEAKLQSAGPSTMNFVQTLTPAGFSGGDSEKGVLDLDLPRCLRWDYEEPYPRSFLICGTVGYHWNEGEAVGRRFTITLDEPGLDILLQEREQLANRYAASLETARDEIEIILKPVQGSLGEMVEARLRLDAATAKLRSLSYRDKEGNHNRFVFSDRPEPTGRDTFSPPEGIAWSED